MSRHGVVLEHSKPRDACQNWSLRVQPTCFIGITSYAQDILATQQLRKVAPQSVPTGLTVARKTTPEPSLPAQGHSVVSANDELAMHLKFFVENCLPGMMLATALPCVRQFLSAGKLFTDVVSVQGAHG
jgi:hypothetical protein